jgi:hypothetical protein
VAGVVVNPLAGGLALALCGSPAWPRSMHRPSQVVS